MCCIITYYQVWRRLLCQVWGKGKDCKELETWEGWQWHHGQWPLAKGRGRATGGSLSALWWWSCICIDARAVSGTAWCMQDHQPNPFGVVGSHAYIWQQIISTIHFFLSHAVSFSNGITRASIIHPPKIITFTFVLFYYDHLYNNMTWKIKERCNQHGNSLTSEW